MDVDETCNENAKKILENLQNLSSPEPLLGSITTSAVNKEDKGLQIRSSARVFKKMKLEQELDRKNEDKSSLDHTLNSQSSEANPLSSPVTEYSVSAVTFPDKSAETEVKGPQIRSSTRVTKKTKHENPNVSDTKAKKEETKPDSKKVVRANWTFEDKMMFFEAVNEYGKDFENITQYINSKLRRKGASEEQLRTKDIVRQFYNRTFHEVSKHVKFSETVKKVVQELYGIINYGELLKKLGSISSLSVNQSVTEKGLLKLNELIYRGSTCIRSKGKTIRIKTPMCRALIKLNQLDEKYQEVRLPHRVTIDLRPKDMNSYLKVQSLAQNPRLRTTLPLQKRLSSLIECLKNRWKTVDTLNYEKSVISTNPITADCVPSKEEINEKLEILSPLLRISPPAEAKIDLPLINLSDYLTRQTICLTAYESRLGLDTFSEIKLVTKRKRQQRSDHEQKSESVSDVKTEIQDIKIENLKSDENDANSSNETEPDPLIADVVDDAVNTILSLQQMQERPYSEMSETEEPLRVEPEKEEVQTNIKVEVVNTEMLEQIERFRKGWTQEESESLTIGELYLMYGSDSKFLLEYSWGEEVKTEPEKPIKNTANFLERWKESYEESLQAKQKNLTTSLTKLLSLAKLHYGKTAIQCPCGHICNGKNPNVKSSTNLGASKVRRSTIIENNIDLDNIKQDQILLTVVPNRPQQLGDTFSRTPVYIQPKGTAFHTPTMQQQLNSIRRLKPKYCNRKGRPRSKQVVVERKLPLLPNNLSGHQIVRMNIISQEPKVETLVSQPSASESQAALSVVPSQPMIIKSEIDIKDVIVNYDPDEENSSISTVPSSPSRILKEGDSEWISAEVADYSLSSLLGHLESPIKNPVPTSISASMASDLSSEVDAQLHSLLTESSMDFAANFADLAASVVSDKKF